jgi:hypothetical protein
MDMRFDTWNGKKLYRAGLFMGGAKGIPNYKFDLVGVQ